MLKKSHSEQSLTRQAKISLSKKLPSDFFHPGEFNKQFPLKRTIRLMPIADQSKISCSVKPTDDNALLERKNSFEFTFYRSHSTQTKKDLFQQKKEKSSKMDILEKFNLKLPHIVKSAESGLERRKKLIKVKRISNFNADFLRDEISLAMR